MRTAIANNACKFHEDRLNDGVTIYVIVAKPRGTWLDLTPSDLETRYRSIFFYRNRVAYYAVRNSTTEKILFLWSVETVHGRYNRNVMSC